MNIKSALILVVVLMAGLASGYGVKRYFQFANSRPSVETGDFARYHKASEPDVILYSLSTCPYCKMTKKLLDQHKVEFVERVVDKSPSARQDMAALGAKQVPVLLIGKYKIQGYGEDEILAALKNAESAKGGGGN